MKNPELIIQGLQYLQSAGMNDEPIPYRIEIQQRENLNGETQMGDMTLTYDVFKSDFSSLIDEFGKALRQDKKNTYKYNPKPNQVYFQWSNGQRLYLRR